MRNVIADTKLNMNADRDLFIFRDFFFIKNYVIIGDYQLLHTTVFPVALRQG